MKKIIEDLFKFDRYLLGRGYNEALDYINNIIPLEVHSFKSGTKVFDWTIPKEWVIKEGWVKFNGEKILDYKDNPLCIAVGSTSVHETLSLEDFKKHLRFTEDRPDDFTYTYFFYESDWAVTLPKNKVQLDVHNEDGSITKSSILQEGEYEVFIDSEFIPSELKIGVHTITGKSDREILLFAHLDHPWQANDNLSGVACLIDMVDRLKNFNHTIKIVFCPETIGSITYANKLDISKVDFVIALDAIGNKTDDKDRDSTLLFQKSFLKSRLNDVALLALQQKGADYRAAAFRFLIGSDEYVFNDPLLGIPGIMLSRFPYAEYHTSADTPDIISEEKIKDVQDVIYNIIDIYERDFIPKRKMKAPLFRSKYGVQTTHKLMNLNLDYLWYDIDGKKYLSEIISPLGMSFDFVYDIIIKIKTTLWPKH